MFKKQTYFIILKILFFIGILYYILSYQNIYFKKIYDHLINIPIGFIGLILINILIGEWIQSVIISKILALYKIHIPASKCYQINLIATFYSFFLLGSLGGTSIRWHRLSQINKNPTTIITALLIQRILIVLILLLGLAMLIIFQESFQMQPLSLLIPSLAGLFFFMFLTFTLMTYQPWISFLEKNIFKFSLPFSLTWLPFWFKTSITKFLSSLTILKGQQKKLLYFFLLSSFYRLFTFFNFYSTILSIKIEISFINLSILFLTSKGMEIIPNVFGGLGLREFLFLGVHQQMNHPYSLAKEDFITIAFLQFCFIFIISILGGILEIYDQFFKKKIHFLKISK